MFKKEELNFKNPNIKIILNKLLSKAENGNFLSETEKDFLCISFINAKFPFNHLVDQKYCENYQFKRLLRVYYRDLTGKGSYKKRKNGIYNTVNEECVRSDIKILNDYAAEWEDVINITNHNCSFLKIASKETRDDLKGINKKDGSENYQINKLNILLASKYIYIYI